MEITKLTEQDIVDAIGCWSKGKAKEVHVTFLQGMRIVGSRHLYNAARLSKFWLGLELEKGPKSWRPRYPKTGHETVRFLLNERAVRQTLTEQLGGDFIGWMNEFERNIGKFL